jgi:hypothetical protein
MPKCAEVRTAPREDLREAMTELLALRAEVAKLELAAQPKRAAGVDFSGRHQSASFGEIGSPRLQALR